MTWHDFLERLQRATPDVGWMELLPALLAGLVTILLIRTGLSLAVRKLRQLSARTRTTADDHLVGVLERTNPFIVGLVGVLVGLKLLPLDDLWHQRLGQAWFAVLALQLALWAQEAVARMLAVYQGRHGGGTTLSASATLLGWGLRGAVWVVVVLAVLSNLGVNITAFVASLGIGGIAIALAVQNILSDLFASLAIAVDKPFEVGDSITVGDVNGTVERVGLKTTRIRSLGGEQIVMSNAELLKRTVANFKRLQTRRAVLAFGISHDTPADDVAAVPPMVKALIEADPMLEFARAHFKGFGERSLDFEAVYRVKDPSYDVYMDRQQALNLALMRGLEDRGIRLAFPAATLNIVGLPQAAASAG